MCGVLAFKGKYQKNLVQKLILESSIRGTHSFGYSYIDDKIITKKFHDINEAIKSISEISPGQFIFHNRYSTSGDYKDHLNNQPIAIGDKSLVFNGVISQMNKSRMEEFYQVKMQTENDGEIALLKNFNEDFLKSLKGSFAGSWIINNKIYYFRNPRRPLYISHQDNFTVIASTKDILARSGLNGELIEPGVIKNL